MKNGTEIARCGGVELAARTKKSILSKFLPGPKPSTAEEDCPRHTDPRECDELAEALGSRTVSRIRLEHAIAEEIWTTAVRVLGIRPFERWMRQWEPSDAWRYEAPWPSLSVSVALHHLPIAQEEKSATECFLGSGAAAAWCRSQQAWLRAQGEARLSLYEVKTALRLEDALSGMLVDLGERGVPAGFVAKPGELVLARPLVWRGDGLLLPWDLDGHVLTGERAAKAKRAAARGEPQRLFEAWYAAIESTAEWLQ